MGAGRLAASPNASCSQTGQNQLTIPCLEKRQHWLGLVSAAAARAVLGPTPGPQGLGRGPGAQARGLATAAQGSRAQPAETKMQSAGPLRGGGMMTMTGIVTIVMRRITIIIIKTIIRTEKKSNNDDSSGDTDSDNDWFSSCPSWMLMVIGVLAQLAQTPL